VSFFDGVPMVLLFSNTSAYAAVSSATSAATMINAGSTGVFEQAAIPYGFLQQGRPGPVLHIVATGTVTAESSATTMTLALGSNESSNVITGGTNNLTWITLGAYTVTSFSGVVWQAVFDVNFRTVGYGTTTISSTPYAVCNFTINASGGPPTSALATDLYAPSPQTTLDGSQTQYLWMSNTFSTASATNSITLQQMIMFGSQ
jgi:hypothetical protein